MNTIDLRSDTVTRPTDEMRRAMYEAEVGDDVFEEDPTVRDLEELSAERLGKDAGLFVASGTMGNLVSLLTHLGRGEEALIGAGSHIHEHEQGSASSLGGIVLRALHRGEHGSLDPDEIEASIAPDDVHKPRTKLLCAENAYNGRALGVDEMKAIWTQAARFGLKTHLDGARLFNAATAHRVDVHELVEGFDSVQFCFSKGLCAPAGSMIVSNRDFIKQARRWRKALGGGMRQIGVLAAACRIALTRMTLRLEEDHATAALLYEQLGNIKGIKLIPELRGTNMVWFDVDIPGITALDFVRKAEEEGVLVFDCSRTTIRAVTHHGISEDDAREAASRFARVAAGLRTNCFSR